MAGREARVSGSPAARYALRLIVAAALLAYVFSRVPLASVIESAGNVDRTLLLSAFLLTLIVQGLAAARLRLALASQDVGLSLWAAFEINMAARFYNLFIPGGTVTGMAVRILKVSRHKRDLTAAGTAVLADRLVATLMLCVVGIGFWLLQRPLPDLVWLALFVACGAALALGVQLLIRPAGPGGLGRLIPERFRARAESLREGLQRAGRLGGGVMRRMVILSLAAHLAGVGCYWLVLTAMALGLSPIEAGWIRSVLLLVTLLPISLAGLGVREAGAYLVMRAYGLDASTAVTFSLLVALVTVIGTGLLGGLLETLRFTRRDSV